MARQGLLPKHTPAARQWFTAVDGVFDLSLIHIFPCISHPLADEDARKSYPQWDDIVARTCLLYTSRCV